LCGSSGWSNLSNLAKILRKILKNSYILVPGYGAQGGTARDVAHCLIMTGSEQFVNASRSIMCAYKSEQWKNVYSEEKFYEASRAEAIRMRTILTVRCETGSNSILEYEVIYYESYFSS